MRRGAPASRGKRSDNIGVFLLATDLDKLYTQRTREFGEFIGRAGHTLVGADSIPG